MAVLKKRLESIRKLSLTQRGLEVLGVHDWIGEKSDTRISSSTKGKKNNYTDYFVKCMFYKTSDNRRLCLGKLAVTVVRGRGAQVST